MKKKNIWISLTGIIVIFAVMIIFFVRKDAVEEKLSAAVDVISPYEEGIPESYNEEGNLLGISRLPNGVISNGAGISHPGEVTSATEISDYEEEWDFDDSEQYANDVVVSYTGG